MGPIVADRAAHRARFALLSVAFAASVIAFVLARPHAPHHHHGWHHHGGWMPRIGHCIANR